MKIHNVHNRLFSLWGVVDKQHNELIASVLTGKRILDIGCGYGSLVGFLSNQGYEAEGIDSDETCIAIARKLFPGVNVRTCNAVEMSDLADHSFDAIVLKDCLHHLIEEGDVTAIFKNFRRILKDSGMIVILDPNITVFLRLARKLILHKDPEASVEVALDLLQDKGFLVRGVQYYETIGLPLSGGYVGPMLVPNWPFLNKFVASVNHYLSRLVNQGRLGRYLCWRYLIYADILKII